MLPISSADLRAKKDASPFPARRPVRSLSPLSSRRAPAGTDGRPLRLLAVLGTCALIGLYLLLNTSPPTPKTPAHPLVSELDDTFDADLPLDSDLADLARPEWSASARANEWLLMHPTTGTNNATARILADPAGASIYWRLQHAPVGRRALRATLDAVLADHFAGKPELRRSPTALLAALGQDDSRKRFGDPDKDMKARVALAHLHRDLVRVHFAATSVLPHISAAEPKTLLVIRKLTRALDRILYPWLPEDAADLVDIKSPRAPWKRATTGLVFSVGRGYMRHALVCIANVRQHLGMQDMPVTIAYAGERDLPTKYREAMVQQVGELDWLDLEKVLGGPEVIRKYEVKGWATKAFALLFAPYQHSILVDADTVFLQPPTPLLTTADPGYLATGTLFFHDRTLFPSPSYKMLDWVTKWLPSASPHARQTRHWRGLSAHEMESGVVSVDKSRPGVLLTLLMMVAMNTQPLRSEQVYKVMHGDKETYFLAAEAVRELYTFMPGFGGTIGYLPAADRPHIKQPGRTTCGLLLHTDRTGEPVWFNGGVEKDKYAGDGELFNATHWVRDVDGKGVDWEFGEEVLDGFCMTKKGEEGDPRELSGEMAGLIEGLKGSYLKMRDAVGEVMWLGKA